MIAIVTVMTVGTSDDRVVEFDSHGSIAFCCCCSCCCFLLMYQYALITPAVVCLVVDLLLIFFIFLFVFFFGDRTEKCKQFEPLRYCHNSGQ